MNGGGLRRWLTRAAVVFGGAAAPLTMINPIAGAVAAVLGALAAGLVTDLPREQWTAAQRAAKLGAAPVTFEDETPPKPVAKP